MEYYASMIYYLIYISFCIKQFIKTIITFFKPKTFLNLFKISLLISISNLLQHCLDFFLNDSFLFQKIFTFI